MVEKKFYDVAIAYINENKTWTAEEEQIAMDEMAGGIPLRRTSTGGNIINRISEVLDEFASINNLPDEWWRDFADSEEDVFWDLD
jgi:hypothetical protein